MGPFSPEEMHKRIEAMKLAYSDVRRYNADPRTYDPPVARLLSKDYAKKRAALIDPAKANCDVPPGQPVGSDTTYLTMVDKGRQHRQLDSEYLCGIRFRRHGEGMGSCCRIAAAASLSTRSIPTCWRAASVRSTPSFPRSWRRGDQHIGFGIMGGANQPLAHAQFVSNVVDYGMNMQAALEAPRFTKRNSTGCDVSIESRVPAGTLQQLSERGHQVAIRREYTQEMGRGQAILHDSKTGMNYAASDPRADGAATPEPVRY